MLDDCTIEIRKHILISARHNRDGPIIGPSVYGDHPTMCVCVCVYARLLVYPHVSRNAHKQVTKFVGYVWKFDRSGSNGVN